MAIDGHAAEAAPIVKRQRADLGAAQTRRVLDHCLEHWSQLPRRARDDAQRLGGRRLLLQRLGEVLMRLGKLRPRFCEFPSARLKFLFELRSGFADAANACSRLRCLRTKTGNASSAI